MLIKFSLFREKLLAHHETIDEFFLTSQLIKILLFNVIIYSNVTLSDNFYFLFLVLISKFIHTFV